MMNFSKKKDSTERIGLLVAASLRVNKLAVEFQVQIA
jgi:hypothetical protein